MQSRFLLRPSELTNEIIVGIFGKALETYPAVSLHALAVLSNHMQGLVSSTDGESLAGFMCFVNGNIARKVGKIVGWREAFWGRRYRAIPVLDDESQVARLKYILSQSVQEGLVPRPELWPGVHCVRALTEGVALRGTWFDQTQQYYARRAREEVGPRSFGTPYEIVFSPLPCWADLALEEREERCRKLVAEIVAENDVPGRSWLGVEAILAQDPHGVPETTKRSPAPLCHAATEELWRRYCQFFRSLFSLFKVAATRLRNGIASAIDEIPAHCFPPHMRWRSTGPCLELPDDPAPDLEFEAELS